MNEKMGTGTVDERIKDISDFLRSSVLDPAQQQKESIISEAEAEKEKIITQAKAEAEKIVSEAKQKAEHEKETLESTLRISARQAVDTLKKTIEEKILALSVEAPARQTLSSADIMKELITSITHTYLTEEIANDMELTISPEIREKLESFIKSDVIEKSKNSISLSSEKVPSGFQLTFRDQKLMLDFSTESVVELIAEFVRADLRKYLFGQ